MTAKPWMRWHVDRWRKSGRVMSMTLAARGAFFELLQAAWERGGALPNTPELFWRFAQASSAAEFEAVKDQVLGMFTVSEDGKALTNDTLAEEYRNAEEYMAQLSEKRRSAANVRWSKKRCKNANGMQGASKPIHISSSSSSSSTEEESKPCASAGAEGAGASDPPKQPAAEPRHKPTEQRIKTRHQERFNLACQWDGSEGRALSEVLGANKAWTQEQIFQMVDNVFASTKNNGRPREWLRSLSKWADGPKDDFGKTIGAQGAIGKGNGQKDKCAEITRATSEALLDRRRARRVASSEIGDAAECVPKSAVN